MPNEINVERSEADFLYPQPTFSQKLKQKVKGFFARALPAAEPVAYAEGIDESKYQYSATKRVNHAAALAGDVTFTVIRVSNCVTADPYFEQAWKDAMAVGMPVLIYANVQGYKGGAEQARFAIDTAAPFIAACKHKVVIIGDFEADGLTMTVAARQKLAIDFLNEVHLHYETGIYSNIKYWQEMYGNMKPPAWAWLYGAHWTSAAKGAFPSSWDLSKMIIWQYGVWDNYSWALPVPGNVPDIDKDRWVWAGGDVAAFLKVDAPVPPAPAEHTHADLQAQITALAGRVAALENLQAGGSL